MRSRPSAGSFISSSSLTVVLSSGFIGRSMLWTEGKRAEWSAEVGLLDRSKWKSFKSTSGEVGVR